MVDRQWAQSRRHYYLLGAAGLIAASGWLLLESLPCTKLHVLAGASSAYSLDDNAGPRCTVLADDAPAAAAIRRPAPRVPDVAASDPARGSVGRRLAALVQAPKHGPPA